MIFLIALLAFYVAWNLGANDVANSMGTSIGSKAVTSRQALAIAGILEFTGAVLFGRAVSETLAIGIVNPTLFASAPEILLIGMISVLVAFDTPRSNETGILQFFCLILLDIRLSDDCSSLGDGSWTPCTQQRYLPSMTFPQSAGRVFFLGKTSP